MIAGPAKRGRTKSLLIIGTALFLAVLLAAASAWAGLLDSSSLGAPDQATRIQSMSGPADAAIASANERSIYDVMGDWSLCLKDPQKWVGALIRNQADAPGLRDNVQAMTKAVSFSRRLKPRGKVQAEFLPPGQVGQRAGANYEDAYTRSEAALDKKILVALGAIEKDVNLRATGKTLLEQQIVGLYSPREKRLFASSDGDKLGPMDEMVLAHEIAHAIVDSRIGLPSPKKQRLNADQGFASRALAEGDANLAMVYYMVGTRTPEELMELGEEFSPEATGIKDAKESGAPYFMRRKLAFPYEEGFAFVCKLFDTGGWRAVDNAYRDLPASTAEILFPDRYGVAEPPAKLAAPKPLGGDWKKVDSDVVGAADLLSLFEAPDGKEPEKLGDRVDWVAGWNGDRIDTWQRGSEIALVMSFSDGGIPGPNGRVTSSLCDHLGQWHEEAFPSRTQVGETSNSPIWKRPGGYSAVVCDDALAHYAYAPDRPTLDRLIAIRSTG